MWLARIFLLLLCAAGCSAQEWEAGAAIGYGAYKNGTIFAPAGTVAAGIRNRFVAGVAVTQNRYEYISGELRYTYQDGDPFLSSGRLKINIQGQSHALHYNVLFHARPRREKIRPYIVGGIGAKYYVVSGPENPSQPLSGIALLKSTDQMKFLATAGAGVKMVMSHHVLLRLDFCDYITTFPRKQIQPAPLGTARGIFHQLTPLAGVSYVF